MALAFGCPDCGQDVVVRYLKLGDQVKCPFCGAYGVVPPEARTVDDTHVSSLAGVAGGPSIPARERPQAVAPPTYLASRWKRFWGHLIDNSIVLIPTGVVAMTAAAVDRSFSAPALQTPHQWFLRFSESVWAAVITLIVVVIAGLQAGLLITRGQTVGKLALGTRIVTMSNGHPSWWRLVLVRPLIILIGTSRPQIQWTDAEWGYVLRMVFGGLFLANALFVFASDRRALHDHLAGTQVVDLNLLERNGSAIESGDRG
jgi:uncharacterized RDD family membrane protein YckC